MRFGIIGYGTRCLAGAQEGGAAAAAAHLASPDRLPVASQTADRLTPRRRSAP